MPPYVPHALSLTAYYVRDTGHSLLAPRPSGAPLITTTCHNDSESVGHGHRLLMARLRYLGYRCSRSTCMVSEDPENASCVQRLRHRSGSGMAHNKPPREPGRSLTRT